MTQKKDESRNDKISPEFAHRLASLEASQTVRAILLLQTRDAEGREGKRQSRAERRAAIDAMRKAAEQALDDVDDVLERYGGQRLAERPSALGSITVETTAAGINALAFSDWVKAIMEDQSIFSIF